MTALLAAETVTELVHTYRPRGAARALLACRDDEVVLDGPAGTGKSRACLEKLNRAALKYAGMRGLIVRQVRDTLGASALETFEKWVVAEQMAAGTTVYRAPTARKPARYEYSNGSELWIAGMDKPSKIMSTEFDMIYIQEACELKVGGWEALTTRVGRGAVMPYQQLIADCNPEHPGHWLNQRKQQGKVTFLSSRHADNPMYYDDQGGLTDKGRTYLAKLDNLTGVRRLRLRDGIWAAAEGIIWESWDPAVHVVPRFDIPAGWPRLWSVDFGMRHPFVWQAWAVAPDGELYRYREIHMSGRIVEDHAKQIMGIVSPGATWNDTARRWEGGEWIEPKPQKILCDHDAEDRETLARYLGMHNHPADKRVKPGLEAVEKRLRERRVLFMEGSLVEVDPQAADDRKPTCTEDEIPGYVWDDAKEAPVKEDDDGCDTLRYVVADQDLKPHGPIYRSFEG